MTAEELIRVLESYPPETPVTVLGDGGWVDVEYYVLDEETQLNLRIW